MIKKRILILFFIIFLFYNKILSFDSQIEIAKKYSDSKRIPVEILEPENGKKIGFILYYDLDDDERKEIIIPYRIKMSEKEIENYASPFKQILAIDIVKDSEIIRNFIKIDLAYTYTPKVYITIKRLKTDELPKVFLLINDGFSKEKGPDAKFTLLFKSLNEKEVELRKFETVKMPWNFILYQFSETPTVNEFYTLTKEGKGVFYIRTVNKNDNWPKISMEKINDFIKELKNYKKQIDWEYGPISSGIKP